MIKIKTFLILPLLVFSFLTKAQNSFLEIGKPAPTLLLSEIIKGPKIDQVSLAKLKGKVVVLEFWATWCGPCVAAFPHINELAEKYKNKSVVFISISVDEGTNATDKIKKLLETRPLKTWIVKDGAGNPTQKSYNVHSIPATFLIDKNGNLDAITNPSELKEETLDNLLEGKPSGIVKEEKIVEPKLNSEPVKNELAPVFSISIKESTNNGSSTYWNKKGIGAKGFSSEDIIGWLFEIESKRMIAKDSIPLKYWNCEAKFPETISVEETKNYLKKVVPPSIGVVVEEGKKEMNVFILKCPNGIKTGKKSYLQKVEDEGGSHMSHSDGFIAGTRVSIGGISEMVAEHIHEIFIDETGLKGKFDFSLNYREGDMNSIMEALNECGLELVKEKKILNVLFISNAPQSASPKVNH